MKGHKITIGYDYIRSFFFLLEVARIKSFTLKHILWRL